MYEVIVYLEDQGSGPVLVLHHLENGWTIKEERFTFDRAHVSKELLDNHTVEIVE